MSKIVAVVLAAGKGIRMKSNNPKVLHKISGKPMVFYTLENLRKISLEAIILVIGYKAELVKKVIKEEFPKCLFAFQKAPLGTADALKCAVSQISLEVEEILVLNGDDSAFYSSQTLINFIDSHSKHLADVSMMVTQADESRRVGRVIRDESGKFKIVLEASEYERENYKSLEINCGAYIFKKDWLKENIEKVEKSESGEYYITDLLNIARKQDNNINLYRLERDKEWVGVNTQKDLEYANSQ